MNPSRKNKIVSTLIPFTALSVIAVLSGCSQSDSPKMESDTNQGLEALLLSTKPTEAITVADARESLKAGDPATVTGQIGGADKPFIEGYAGFILADESIMFCDETGDDDHCSTPWDACCEDPDKVTANRLTVQFTDETGNPIAGNLKGISALSELDIVTVKGTVAEGSDEKNLVINATHLYRETK